MSAPDEREPRRVELTHVRAVRVGHGANCSSIGSVIDTLFVTTLVGGAVFAAVMAALAHEPVRVVAIPDATPDEGASGDAGQGDKREKGEAS